MNRFREYGMRLLPLLGALALFFGIAALYFAPQFSGEVLPQHDVRQYEGMSRDILENRQQTGEDPQWTGRMFGGMPAYLINVAYPAQLVKRAAGAVTGLVRTPAAFLFFAMTAMWIMLMLFGVDRRAAVVGALAYGLSTYFLLIIGAGHLTKMWAAVYAPLMMGGICTALRRDRWTGAALTALFAALEIGANHPQITYDFLLAAGLFWISEAVVAFRRRTVPDFLKRSALLLAAGIVAVGANFAPLYYTMRHSPETIRGGSEIARETGAAAEARSGLDLDYATAWSYGPVESFNLLIPDFMGGGSRTPLSRGGAVDRTMQSYGLPAIGENLPAYWGDQPYTEGPTYLGAVAVFLAVLGLLLAENRDRWWLAAASLLALLLSWGYHFMPFTKFCFDWLPGYDKFRTVSMILVVVQWSVPLLGALGLMRLWRRDDPKRMTRALAWSAGITGGLCLLFAVAGGSLFDFGRAAAEQEMTATFGAWFRQAGLTRELQQGLDFEVGRDVAEAIASERAAIMKHDAWRSLAFVALAAGAVFVFLRRKFHPAWLAAALGVLVVADMVPVDLRYLSKEDFVPARLNRIEPTEADRQILRDTDPGYRVLNLTVSPFNDATTSYFHRSVGGYHGAKLARYQDLIDRWLKNLDEEVLDMLNTRYVIVGRDSVLYRETANGPAWFVEYVTTADSAVGELDRLGEIDTKRVAVVRSGDTDRLFRLVPEPADSIVPFEGAIRLSEYRPNYLKYDYTASDDAVAVFSEIFADSGWRAFVDGEPADYVRADYVLRAMQLPAGEHTVEWRFRAPRWAMSEGITLAASLAIWAACAAVLVRSLLRCRRKPERPLTE